MGDTKTNHHDGIIRRQIRSGRASSKTEVIYQALSQRDAVTRSREPAGSSFTNAEKLEALLLEAGPARPMTAARKSRIYGDLKQ